jgi:hypothetical protein
MSNLAESQLDPFELESNFPSYSCLSQIDFGLRASTSFRLGQGDQILALGLRGPKSGYYVKWDHGDLPWILGGHDSALGPW